MGTALGVRGKTRPLQPASISGSVRVLSLATSLAVLACSGIHLVMLSQLPAPSTADVVALLGMAMICLTWVPHTLLDVRQRAWIYMGLVSGGMLTGHSLLHYFDDGHAQHMNMS